MRWLTDPRSGMRKRKTKGRIGSSFDEFLDEEGIRESVHDLAIKEIISDQIAAAMKTKGITKSVMARRMGTSRRQLDRLLDPRNASVTLLTLRRAAAAVGRKLRVELR
jgi:antitoxin HicB